MAADEWAGSEDGVSATDVFGTVPKEAEPARRPAPRPLEAVSSAAGAAPVPVEAVPAVSASSGGFTQLLRALNYDAVKEVPPAAPVTTKAERPAVDGPMTQLLRTISASDTNAMEKPSVPPRSAQVTSFLPHPAPVAPGAATVVLQPPEQTVRSSTSLLGSSEAAPSGFQASEAAAVPPLLPQLSVAPEPVASPSDRPEPVSLTQLFGTVASDTTAKDETVPEMVPDALPASAPGSFTQMFQALGAPSDLADPQGAEPEAASPERKLEALAVVPVTRPGSFTQMFQALDAPANNRAPALSPTAPVEPPGAPLPGLPQTTAPPPATKTPIAVAAPPSSFTQIFQTLDAPPVEAARNAVPGQIEEPSGASVAPPGSFTQMFRTLPEEPRSPVPAAVPGSFTQLFAELPVSSPATAPPASASYDRSFAPSGPAGEGGKGDWERGGASREPQPQSQERKAEFSFEETGPVEQAPVSTPTSRGLTQLLRALDAPAPGVRPYGAAGSPQPVVSTPQAGSFTGVYGELGTPAGMPSPPVTTAQTVNAGPSEFTRLINASAVREAELRGGGGATGIPPAPAPSGGGAGLAMPGALHAGVPHASFATPSAPHASIAGPGGTHASLSAGGGGSASLSGPHIPPLSAASAVRLPEISKAAGSPAGIQRYVPLLLILVIFLLLAILVAVVVLMKK